MLGVPEHTCIASHTSIRQQLLRNGTHIGTMTNGTIVMVQLLVYNIIVWAGINKHATAMVTTN